MQAGDFPSFRLPLVIDVSSPDIQVGIAHDQGWKGLIASSGQVMDCLLPTIDQLFKRHDGSFQQLDALFYCCGPGSTLGLRLAASVVKTLLWEKEYKIPFFQYNALDLASCMTKKEPQSLQAPFRMGRRIIRTGERAKVGKKEIVDEQAAMQKYPQSLHLAGPRKIALEIPHDQILEYNLEKVKGLSDLYPLAEATDQPVPYSPEPAKFVKWQGKIPAKK